MRWLKNSAAAVLAYAVMFGVAFLLFSLMWAVLGPGRAFQAGSWNVSGAWVISSLALGMVVSVAGGFACARLAPDYAGVSILMALVVLLGIASGLPDASPTATLRGDGTTMFEAMASAVQPTWLLWLNPFLGVLGVWLGARLHASREPLA